MRTGPFFRIVTLVGMCQMVTKPSRYNSPMLRLSLCFISAAYLACAAEVITPEAVLLGRARHHMSQMLTNLPNYTCLQTIERTQRLAPKKKPTLLDVVRI